MNSFILGIFQILNVYLHFIKHLMHKDQDHVDTFWYLRTKKILVADADP